MMISEIGNVYGLIILLMNRILKILLCILNVDVVIIIEWLQMMMMMMMMMIW